MTFLLTARCERDLAAPAAQAHRAQILKALRNVKENPELPALRVRRSHLGVRYCRASDDWRILFDWNDQGEPVFYRIVSHADFDKLTSRSVGATELSTLGLAAFVTTVSTATDLRHEDASEETSRARSHYPARPADNPLRLYSLTQLRLLGIPEKLVDDARRASTLESVLDLPGLPEHTLTWLMQLSTDPTEPLLRPFVTLKEATLEQLEGFCTGRIQDLLLRLTADQRVFVDRDYPGAALVRGCAGSGKSTIGVYRAIRKAMEGQSVLLVAFSPLLKQVTEDLIQRLVGALPPHLRVAHVREWLAEMLSFADLQGPTLTSEDEIGIIRECVRSVSFVASSPLLSRDASFFRDELQRVIKGFGLQTFDEYRAAKRYGRQEALGPAARFVVWKVFEEYQSRLNEDGTRDWGDNALTVRNWLQTTPCAQLFDHVIVDEAQDLTPVELMALRLLVAGCDRATVLLLGDAAQSIYSRGFSWKQAGLDVVGRSFALRTNYRNTREVVRTAGDLISRNTHLKLAHELTEITSIERSGPPPVVVMVKSQSEMVKLLAERILEFRERNILRLRDIAILAPTADDAQRFKESLSVKGVPADFWRDDSTHFDLFTEAVKVMPTHLAKGLEFPVVFLVDTAITPATSGSRVSIDLDTQIEVERQRMLSYVGITRCAEILYIVLMEGRGSGFAAELNHVVTMPPFT